MFKAIVDFFKFYFVIPSGKKEVVEEEVKPATAPQQPTATKTRSRTKATKKPNGTTKSKTKK